MPETKEKTHNYPIRLSWDLWGKLVKEATKRHLSVAGLIKTILWEALEKGKEGKG